MNFTRLRLRVLLGLGALCFGFLMICAGLAFSFWDGLVTRVIPEPEYELVYVQQLAREWHDATRMTVVFLHEPEISEEEFEKRTGAIFPPAGSEAEREGLQSFRSSLANDPRFTRARLDSTIAEFVLLDQNRLLLFAVYGRSGQVQNGVVPPFKSFRAVDYGSIMGQLPAGPQIMKFPLYARLTHDLFQAFDWQSTDEPQQRGFYIQFNQIVSFWQTALPPYHEFVGKVRAAAGARFFGFRRVIRWGFTPASILFSVLCLACLMHWHGTFLENRLVVEFRRIPVSDRKRVRLPGLFKFLVTSDLSRLESRCLAELRAVRQEYLEAERRNAQKRRAELRQTVRPSAGLPVAETPSNLEYRFGSLMLLFEQKFGQVKDASSREEIRGLYWEAVGVEGLFERIKKLQEVIRLTSEAIRTEKNAVVAAAPKERSLPAVRHLRKQQLLFQQLSVLDDCFDPDLDADMAKTILVVLWGQSATGVQAHHRRRQTLAGRAWRYYTRELRKPFNSVSLEMAREWLLGNGVIVPFDEAVSQGNYAIVTDDSFPRSVLGVKMVRLLLQIAQSFTRVAV